MILLVLRIYSGKILIKKIWIEYESNNQIIGLRHFSSFNYPPKFFSCILKFNFIYFQVKIFTASELAN